MNEVIFIFILLITSGTIITTYHFYQKFGLKILLILLTTLTLIMSFKTAKIFSININLNLIPITSIYTLIYILIEKHSKKELQDNIKLIIETIIFTTITFILFTLFIPSINDNIILNINHLLDLTPVIISYILTPAFVFLTIFLYKYLKENNNNFYLNTIICIIITSIIETSITTTIIYFLNFDIKLTVQIILANCLLKIFIMLIYLGIIKLITAKRKWLS